jgi:hypothetical protein
MPRPLVTVASALLAASTFMFAATPSQAAHGAPLAYVNHGPLAQYPGPHYDDYRRQQWREQRWRERQWRIQQWREQQWREQRWREREWRRHQWRQRHGYGHPYPY